MSTGERVAAWIALFCLSLSLISVNISLHILREDIARLPHLDPDRCAQYVQIEDTPGWVCVPWEDAG